MFKNILISVLLTMIMPAAVYSQTEQLVIKIPPSSLPGLLTFENPKGSIKVTGYDGDILLVSGSLRFSEPDKPAENGMHRIEQNALDISAEVSSNKITLLCRTTGKTVDFDIKIPRRFSLKLKSLDNGNIEVFNIIGDIEIENANGDINLGNITGSAVLSSVYGKISALFKEVYPDAPMMLTSFEGDISLTLPESVNALLKIRSEKGEVLSDFDISPTGRKPVVKDIENTKVYTLEDWVSGNINSGGPEYVIKSYNGNIYIKKK